MTKKWIVGCFAILTSAHLVCAQPAESPSPAEYRQTFDNVMSNLDAGGAFLLYLNSTDAVQRLIDQLLAWIEIMPEDEQTAIVKAKAQDVATYLIDAGVNDLVAFGASSAPLENGPNRFKAFLARKQNVPNRPLWKMLGGEPRAMESARFLPRDTVLARVINCDQQAAWTFAKDTVQHFGGQEATDAMMQALADMKEESGIDLEGIMDTLGDEFFISIQLSSDETFSIPMEEEFALPLPSAVIGIASKDDTILKTIVEQMKGMGMPLVKQESEHGSWITMEQRLPLPVPVQPAITRKNGFVLIATLPDVMRNALSAHANGGGLIDSPAYASLMEGLPTENNGIIYLDKRLYQTISDLQLQALKMNQPSAAPMFAKILMAGGDREVGLVRVNQADGIAIQGRATFSTSELLGAVFIAPLGVMAAITVPAFQNAKMAAQQTSCVNNLRMIYGAKEQWALEEGANIGDTPSSEGISLYLMDGTLPSCPQGGAYRIGTVGEAPTCDFPGHTLEQ